MAQLSLHVVLLMFKWLPVACYSYQSKPLFMTFSELAALEVKSQDHSATTVSPSKSNENRHIRSVVVKCFKDRMEVKVEVENADVFGLGFPIDPKRLNLGPMVQLQSGCRAVANGKRAYTFRARHGECGTKLTITDDNVVFSNLLVYTPPPVAGQLLPTSPVSVPLHCVYKRRYGVSSSALKHSRIPVVYTQSPRLDFHHKLNNNIPPRADGPIRSGGPKGGSSLYTNTRTSPVYRPASYLLLPGPSPSIGPDSHTVLLRYR
ncbi:unnamed protein product [Lota lota]